TKATNKGSSALGGIGANLLGRKYKKKFRKNNNTIVLHINKFFINPLAVGSGSESPKHPFYQTNPEENIESKENKDRQSKGNDNISSKENKGNIANKEKENKESSSDPSLKPDDNNLAKITNKGSSALGGTGVNPLGSKY